MIIPCSLRVFLKVALVFLFKNKTSIKSFKNQEGKSDLEKLIQETHVNIEKYNISYIIDESMT